MSFFKRLTLEAVQLPVEYAGLSPSGKQLVRKAYMQKQKGLCYYCRHPLLKPPSYKVQHAKITWSLFPENFQRYPIHLHHDHETGLTLGVVHMRCNAYLWEYENE